MSQAEAILENWFWQKKNPDHTDDGRLMMSDSNRASRDCFFFLSAITDTARKTLVVWRKRSTKKEAKWARKGERTKVNILPRSNIDCLCVMLSSPIWAGHICGELLLQPKADILGRVCVCVRTSEARAAHCIWQKDCGERERIQTGLPWPVH